MGFPKSFVWTPIKIGNAFLGGPETTKPYCRCSLFRQVVVGPPMESCTNYLAWGYTNFLVTETIAAIATHRFQRLVQLVRWITALTDRVYRQLQEPDACNYSCSSWRGYRTNEMNFRVSDSESSNFGREIAKRKLCPEMVGALKLFHIIRLIRWYEGLMFRICYGMFLFLLHVISWFFRSVSNCCFTLRKLPHRTEAWLSTTRLWPRASSTRSTLCCWLPPTSTTGGWWRIVPWHRWLTRWFFATGTNSWIMWACQLEGSHRESDNC